MPVQSVFLPTCLWRGSPGSLGPTRKALKPLYLLSMVGQPLNGPCVDSFLLLYVAVLRFHFLHRHCPRQTRTALISSFVSRRFRLSLFGRATLRWERRGQHKKYIENVGSKLNSVSSKNHLSTDIAHMGMGCDGICISGWDKV